MWKSSAFCYHSFFLCYRSRRFSGAWQHDVCLLWSSFPRTNWPGLLIISTCMYWLPFSCWHFQFYFLLWKLFLFWFKIHPKSVPWCWPESKALVQVMAWNWKGNKPLSWPTSMTAHGAARPQWVNNITEEKSSAHPINNEKEKNWWTGKFFSFKHSYIGLQNLSFLLENITPSLMQRKYAVLP